MQVSIVGYQTMVRASRSMRMDAEFFRADYLAIQERLQAISSCKLGDLPVEIKHPKEITRNYVDEGVIFLRAQNVRPMSIELETNKVFVSADDARTLGDNAIRYKDILMTRSGANFGQCAIYLEDAAAIASSHTFIIRSAVPNPFFLTVFLNTTHGRKLIDKGMYGGSQPEIAPAYLYQIPVPDLSAIQGKIEEVYRGSHYLMQLAKAKYDAARAWLMSELGLADWQPLHRLCFVSTFSELQRAGRMDAEYFQPKYDEIAAAIQEYPGGWDRLENLATLRKGVEVGSGAYLDEGEAGVPFVRVSNLTPFEITEEKHISENLYAQLAAHHQPQPGEILLTKDATPGIANYLREPPPRMIPSGGILRLRPHTDRVDGEYLTLVLNSLLVGQQVNRDGGGSVILHWRPEQVQNTLIPLLPPATQARIRNEVAESFAMRGEARRRLAAARGAVEIAIEQGEAAALEWLEAGAVPAAGGGDAAAG